MKSSPAAFEQIAAWILASRRSPPFILGIGGPGGCGKSTLSHWLLHRIPGAELLPLDDFRLPRIQRESLNLFGSHPDGNNLARLENCLRAARTGKPFQRPTYDPVTGENGPTATVPACSVLLCDGEIAAHTNLRPLFDALILVEAHWRTQLETRLTRDVRDHGYSPEKTIAVFLQSNLRDYPKFAAGAREAASIILHRSRQNRFSIRKFPPSSPFTTSALEGSL